MTRALVRLALLLGWFTAFLALAHGDWRILLAAVLLTFTAARMGRP